MKKITVLPNLITTANLFCGFLSVIKVTRALSENNPDFLLDGAWYIFLAMLFDALDGKVARMVNAASDFGAQLDSLCDAVSFGLAPAYLVYVMQTHFDATFLEKVYPEKFLFMTSAIYICCAILRLARYNVEAGAEKKAIMYFKGIPTPAAAGILCSLVIVFFNKDLDFFLETDLVKRYVLLALPFYVIVCSVLMVSSVRFLHVVSVVSASQVKFEILSVFVALIVLFYINPELSIIACFQLYLLSGLFDLHRKLFSSLLSRAMGITKENEKEGDLDVSD
jgi:CDP-diacylglycerol--serine O-phosphatidyltransferase